MKQTIQKKDTAMTGAEIVAHCLKEARVPFVFAYPGAASMALHHALHDAKVRVILPRHEQGGAFAAGGYARKTGEVGVCMATSGPGATNLVTGIADACADSVPMVVITGQVNQHLIGKNAFQETDIIGMTRLCVKHSYLVLDPLELPQVLAEAFFLAKNGRPGPVVIDIPWDVQQAVCDPQSSPEPSLHKNEIVSTPKAESIDALRTLVKECRRPCLFVGGGIIHSNANKELLAFAEAYQIPVATSLMGIGAFPDDHRLSLKWLGMHGCYAANKAVHECDLLIGVGVRFSDRVTGNLAKFAPRAKIVHADVDPSEINKNKHADLAIVCDAKELFRAMLEKPERGRHEFWLELTDKWKTEHPFKFKKGEGQEIKGQQVVARLAELTKGEATIVTGVGQNQMWAAQFYNYNRPRQLLTSGGLGAMGFGLPTAIGAKLAAPDEMVVLIDGDGGFQMNIQELATVYALNLPLKMIILDNQILGMVSQWEDHFYGGVHADTDMKVERAKRPYPNFVQIAKGYGITGHDVWKADELDAALQKMLAAKEPYLLDIHTTAAESVLPMIPNGETCENIILS